LRLKHISTNGAGSNSLPKIGTG